MYRDLQHQPPVPSPQPPTAANQELIDRLRTLLQAPDFEEQLNLVRHFFILLSLSLSLSFSLSLSLSLSLRSTVSPFSSFSLSRFQITSPRPCSLPLGKFYIQLLIHALENTVRHTDLFLRFTVRASGTRSHFLHTTSQVFGFLLGRSAFRFSIAH